MHSEEDPVEPSTHNDADPDRYYLERIACLEERLARAEEERCALQALVNQDSEALDILSLAKLPHENPFPVLRISSEGRVLYSNPAGKDLLATWGCEQGDRVPPEVLEVAVQSLREQCLQRVELPAAGKIFAAAFTPNRQEGYVNLFAFDISELKRAEHTLRKLSRAVEQSPATVVITDVEGSIEYANPKFTQLTGYSLEEALGQNPRILKSGLTPVEVYAELWSTIRSGGQWRGEFCNRKKNGELYWENASISPVFNERGEITHFIAVKEDITDRKQAEAALRDSEKRLIDILESTHDSFFALDRNWQIKYANGRFARRFGRRIEDLVGRNFWAVFSYFLGTEVEDRLRQVMGEREPVQFQTDQYVPDCWYEISAYPTHDGLAVFAIDRTGQRAAEEKLRNSEAMLRRYADKLEHSNRDLQEFAFVASHDLQEPLRKISSFGEVLLASSENLDEQQRLYLERMCYSAERMRKMIDDLLMLSRVTTQGRPYEPVDLNQVVHSILSDLEFQIQRTDGKVEVGELPVIEADPLQMRLLLQNLISNGLKYHRPGVPPLVQVTGHLLPDAQVHIQVQDNGIGFDPKYSERIFLPFQRLVGKSQFEGTGIGLAICKKIVERHGGEISASSVPDQGSTFSILLPVQFRP